MEDTALSVASKVVEYLVAPVGRRCGYLIFSNSYVDKLKEELVQLDDARQRVQHSVNEARNNMKLIEAEVERWTKDAETVANKVRDMLEHDGRGKKTCFFGWFPNLKARYCLGREARRTLEDIQALIARSQFRKVYYEDAPPGLVVDTPDVNSSAGDGGNTITDSRASIFQGIMEALNDEKLKVIGVFGPGGVGKTTLLEEVEKKLRKEGKPFHMIVNAKVSRTPDLNNIQGQLADSLKLNLKDKQSQQGRRDLLLQKLQEDPNEKVLIILDDLWDRLDLKAVGIPLGDESMKCKLLLTSRDKSVLEQKMQADRTFHLNGLSNDEAFRLFEKTVGDKLKDDDDLKAKAAQVVRKLAGLPLLITSVASTLKCSNVYTWENTLIKVEDPNIENIVKLSYDHLEREDAKSLFLLCGLIGGSIPVELLLGLGLALGLFEGFNKTIQSSRNRLSALLDSLRSVCLLQDSSEENVTIHDLYSEVVVSTPFEGQISLMTNSNYGSWPKEKLEKCWAICLAEVGRDWLTELMTRQFPDLKILMLSQPEDWQWMPKHQHDVSECSGLLDFTCTKELRVLFLRSMRIPTLHSSIEILGNLRSLYLDDCHVEDVAILGKLKTLQILSFARSSISRLPKEIGELTNLRSLNLSYCFELEIIEPGVLKGLINLEELLMRDSFAGWMGEDEVPSEPRKAKLVELRSLTKLSAVEISISDPTVLLGAGDLPFGSLIRFWIEIGDISFSREFKGLRTMKLNLEGCDSILSKVGVQKTLHETQHLHLEGLRVSKENIAHALLSAHELCTKGFPQLKHLKIWNSPSIEYIASSSDGTPLTAFPKLESFLLGGLTNLEKIWNGPVALDCFSKLKVVNISRCDRLKNLWFSSEMRRLVHLEEIGVSECCSLRAVIRDDGGNVEVASDDRLVLPNVRSLNLSRLPNMRSFCAGAEGAPIQVSFPLLESLEMVGLLDLEKILYSHPPLQYTNLKSIVISESQSTSSILKSDWILNLPNLESLGIYNCQSTKIVFDLEELKVMGHVEILSRLTELTVSNSPNLEKIWNGPVAPDCFSKLKVVTIEGCGRLKNLGSLSEMRGLVHLEEVKVWECDSLQAIITDDGGKVEVAADDGLVLPNVRRLDLRGLPNMRSFCTGAEGAPIQVSFPSLEILLMDGLLDLEKILYSHPLLQYSNLKSIEIWRSLSSSTILKSDWILKVPNLESLEIRICQSAKFVFDLEELKVMGHVEILSRLTELTLWSLRNLQHVWKQDVHLQGLSIFPNLRKLSVRITRLAFLFSVHVAKCLKEIQEITVDNCPNMEALIVDEEGRDAGTDDIIEFPKLERLDIEKCPMKKFFSCLSGKKELVITTSDAQDAYSGSFFDRKVSLPNLVNLQLDSLKSIKTIWHGEPPRSSFCELATLTIVNCSKLVNVFPSTIIGRLHNLKEVKVSYCPSLESLFDCGTLDPSTEQTRVLLPKLETVSVESCGSLESLFDCGSPDSSTEQTIVPLPRLKEVRVVGAEKLRHVVKSDSLMKEEGSRSKGVVMSFPSSARITIRGCPNLGAFN